jgi:hypothetical protein
LEHYYDKYITYFQGKGEVKGVINRWYTWRTSSRPNTTEWPVSKTAVGFIEYQGTYHTGIYEYSKINIGDNVTRERIERTGGIMSEAARNNGLTLTKELMQTVALLQMASQISSTFLLSKILPVLNKVPNSGPNSTCVDPNLATVRLGFINGNTIDGITWGKGITGVLPTNLTNSIYLKRPMSEIVVREFNAIDSLQFVYEGGHEGEKMGGVGGEESVLTATSDNQFTGLRLRFGGAADAKTNDLIAIALRKMDGSWSKEYGNRNKWNSKAINIEPSIPCYSLAGGEFSLKKGDDKRGMFKGLYLTFQYNVK